MKIIDALETYILDNLNAYIAETSSTLALLTADSIIVNNSNLEAHNRKVMLFIDSEMKSTYEDTSNSGYSRLLPVTFVFVCRGEKESILETRAEMYGDCLEELLSQDTDFCEQILLTDRESREGLEGTSSLKADVITGSIRFLTNRAIE